RGGEYVQELRAAHRVHRGAHLAEVLHAGQPVRGDVGRRGVDVRELLDGEDAHQEAQDEDGAERADQLRAHAAIMEPAHLSLLTAEVRVPPSPTAPSVRRTKRLSLEAALPAPPCTSTRGAH